MADAGFLRAINAEPQSAVARLVYADWLDERGDARGEYLRLLCAAAGWADCPDRAAAVARLQELRGEFADDWLAAVQRGVPWKLLFEANLPTAAAMMGYGYKLGPPATAEQIALAEAALGHRLPDEVRELVAEFNGAEMCDAAGTAGGAEFYDLEGIVQVQGGGEPGSVMSQIVFFASDEYSEQIWGQFLADVGEFRAGETVCWHDDAGELHRGFPSLFEFIRRGPASASPQHLS